MITEKKKRITKPKRGVITDFVLKYCLPFLNLHEDHFSLPSDKNGEDLLRQSVRMIIEPFQRRGETDFLPVAITWDERFEGDFFRLPEARQKLKDLQKKIRSQIYCAVTSHLKSEDEEMEQFKSAYLSEETEKPSIFYYMHFERGIKPIIVVMKMIANGMCDVKNQEKFNSVWIPGLPSIINALTILSISEGLYSEKKSDGKMEVRSPISFFLGYCIKCGMIFKKKQVNAEYCSKYCMNLDFRTTKKK